MYCIALCHITLIISLTFCVVLLLKLWFVPRPDPGSVLVHCTTELPLLLIITHVLFLSWLIGYDWLSGKLCYISYTHEIVVNVYCSKQRLSSENLNESAKLSWSRLLANPREQLTENLACKRSREENIACEIKRKWLVQIQIFSSKNIHLRVYLSYMHNLFIRHQANTTAQQCSPCTSSSQETGKWHWRGPSWEVTSPHKLNYFISLTFTGNDEDLLFLWIYVLFLPVGEMKHYSYY